MDTIKERLEKLVEYTETHSVLRLSQKIDIPKHFLYELNKTRTKQISPAIILALRKVYPEISVNWLETGELPMLVPETETVNDYDSVLADFMLHEIAAIKAQAKKTLATDEYAALKLRLDNLKSKYDGGKKKR